MLYFDTDVTHLDFEVDSWISDRNRNIRLWGQPGCDIIYLHTGTFQGGEHQLVKRKKQHRLLKEKKRKPHGMSNEESAIKGLQP